MAAVALKQVAAKESELELVLEQHSDFPRLTAVKIDAQRRGVHYTERALQTVDTSVQMCSPYFFVSRDCEINDPAGVPAAARRHHHPDRSAAAGTKPAKIGVQILHRSGIMAVE